MLRVAIDGPSGTGKSTIAKATAVRFGLEYIDTGAMYRALGLKARRNGINEADEEAVKAYANTENIQFDCFFINGVKQFVFNGSNISGLDDSGKNVFEHEYKFVKDFSLGGMMDGYLYETDDKDAGEFRYFLMMPDTPASTYHIEFRYGSDMDALAEYNKGAYAPR